MFVCDVPLSGKYASHSQQDSICNNATGRGTTRGLYAADVQILSDVLRDMKKETDDMMLRFVYRRSCTKTAQPVSSAAKVRLRAPILVAFRAFPAAAAAACSKLAATRAAACPYHDFRFLSHDAPHAGRTSSSHAPKDEFRTVGPARDAGGQHEKRVFLALSRRSCPRVSLRASQPHHYQIETCRNSRAFSRQSFPKYSPHHISSVLMLTSRATLAHIQNPQLRSLLPSILASVAELTGSASVLATTTGDCYSASRYM